MKLQTLTALVLALGSVAFAQTEARPKMSIAVESDPTSYFTKGYSGILNITLRNGFQVAFGTGRYDVPGFLVKGEEHYDEAKWKATATSVQVLRVGYRFKGPMKNGPALGAVLFNQSWRLRSEKLAGETQFRPLSVGVTGGYYLHVGKNFYIYPTAAFTYNKVVSGQAALQGVNYNYPKWGPNATVHIGWEFGR